MKKVVRSIVAVLVLFLLAAPLTAQAYKVGVVDLQRILLESSRGKVAKDLLASSTQAKKDELEKAAAGLKKKQEDFEKKAAILSTSAKEDLLRGLQEQQMKLQQLYQQFRQDIQKQDADMTQAILKDIEPILQNLAKKEKFNLVLEKTESGILYAPDKIDLTDRVIRLYDKRK